MKMLLMLGKTPKSHQKLPYALKYKKTYWIILKYVLKCIILNYNANISL